MKYPIVSLIAILVIAGAALGVNATAIDAVRAKTAYSEADAATIDQFVAAVVKEMLDRTDFSDVSVTREAFVTRVSVTPANPKYTELLATAAQKEFKLGLAEADKGSDVEKRTNVKMNLLIMLDKVGQVSTALVAARQIADQDAGVRYWAVQCVANPAVLTQLNAVGEENSRAAAEIASRLKAIVATEPNPNTLDRAVDFGAAVNTPEASELLVLIANRRIKEYEEWRQQYELLDGKLLDALCRKAKGNKAVASAFGQLLSDCMQKHMKQMASSSQSPLLGEQQMGYLATALITAEKGCLSDLLGAGRSNMQNAIAKGAQGSAAMAGEYTLLFGGSGNPGELTKAFGAKYTDAQGKEQDMPRPLPDKPGAVKK
jgi:hypothetical protein